MSTNRYEEIAKLIIKLIDDKDKDYTGEEIDEQRGRLAGCLIRTAGHDFMDYRIDNGGGSDGCFNLKDPDNKGLQSCLTNHGIIDLYDNIVNTLGYSVSIADFLVIAGETAAGRLADDYALDNDGHFKADTFMA
jgi:catalase (peroxidase I)